MSPTMTTDSDWIDLCALADLPAEGGHYVEHANHAYAVFRLAGDSVTSDAVIRVMDDHCPHAGGSLSAGAVVEGCVLCPWHAWPFDVKTGICPDAESYQVKTYEVQVREGRVWVRSAKE